MRSFQWFMPVFLIWMLSVANAGWAATLSGSVRFEGAAPEAQRLDMAADPTCAATHSGGAASEEVVVERSGVRVVMSGDQKIKELTIDGQEDWRIKEAIAEAIKKSQEIAAHKLTEMSGGLQGLLGGGQK